MKNDDTTTTPDLAAMTKADLVALIMRQEGARYATHLIRKALMRRTKAELIERAAR